jgi:hypothetical protein
MNPFWIRFRLLEVFGRVIRCPVFLFLRVVDRLSHVGIEPIWICRNAPSVFDLLFVDGNLLFLKAHKEHVLELKEVIDEYTMST